MTRLSSTLFPAIVVATAISAFAYGGHYHNVQRATIANRPRLHAAHGSWLQEAQSGDGVQPGSAQTQAASDGGFADVFQSDSPYGTFQNVYQLLKDQYVEGIPSDTPLAYGAAEAMLASLDEPNSRFIQPDERKAMEAQDTGVYAGTGILYTVRKATNTDGLTTRSITVIGLIPGSPADKAGIKSGDVIAEVDGHWVIAYDPFMAQEKLFRKLQHDQVGYDKIYTATEAKIADGVTLDKAQAKLDVTSATPVALTIQRPGATDPLKFTLDVSVPTQLPQSVVSRMLPDNRGYIHVIAFNSKTLADFDAALGAMATARGIVIDLRDCAGGEIAPAIAIANSLVPGAEVGRFSVRDAKAKVDPATGFGTRIEPLKASPSTQGLTHTYKGQFVVLVNKTTANTAELFASFLHDRVGARIAGTVTFGDGMAQTLFPLSDGSAFTLSTGELETSAGKMFNVAGITPDVTLADVPIATTDDTEIAKAVGLLSLPPLQVGVVKPVTGDDSISL